MLCVIPHRSYLSLENRPWTVFEGLEISLNCRSINIRKQTNIHVHTYKSIYSCQLSEVFGLREEARVPGESPWTQEGPGSESNPRPKQIDWNLTAISLFLDPCLRVITSRKGCWSLKVALQPNGYCQLLFPKERRRWRGERERVGGRGGHSELNSERDKTVPSPLPPVCSVSWDSTHTFICSSPYLEFISTFRSVLMQASSSALLYIYSYFYSSSLKICSAAVFMQSRRAREEDGSG